MIKIKRVLYVGLQKVLAKQEIQIRNIQMVKHNNIKNFIILFYSYIYLGLYIVILCSSFIFSIYHISLDHLNIRSTPDSIPNRFNPDNIRNSFNPDSIPNHSNVGTTSAMSIRCCTNSGLYRNDTGLIWNAVNDSDSLLWS